MPEIRKITPSPGLVINYSGVFDFDKLYKEMHDWLVSNYYDFNEREHTQKMKDFGAELEIKWLSERKIDNYVLYRLEVNMYISELNKDNGLESGKIRIEISASLVIDYQDKWRTRPLNTVIFKFYNKYVIKEKLNRQTGSLFEDAVTLQNFAKSLLNLYS